MGGAGDQHVKQKVRQQEAGEVIDGEGHLDPVFAQASLGEDGPGIVDQDLQAGILRFERGSQGADGLL